MSAVDELRAIFVDAAEEAFDERDKVLGRVYSEGARRAGRDAMVRYAELNWHPNEHDAAALLRDFTPAQLRAAFRRMHSS